MSLKVYPVGDDRSGPDDWATTAPMTPPSTMRPDPGLMEAWARWYDEHMDVGVRVGPDAFYHAGDVLRRLATDHRREERVERARGAGEVFRATAARAHRDAEP